VVGEAGSGKEALAVIKRNLAARGASLQNGSYKGCDVVTITVSVWSSTHRKRDAVSCNYITLPPGTHVALGEARQQVLEL
jgi:hypothetical protein